MKKHYQQHVFWKGGSAPAAPDYAAQAREQGAADLKAQQLATEANRIDQYTPWGNSTYSQAPGIDGAEGKWSQTTTLDPMQQQILDAQNKSELGMADASNLMIDRVNGSYEDDFDVSGAPAAGRAGFEVNKEYQDALMSRMAPDLLRRRQSQEAALIAQGVGGNTNSEAWDRAQTDLGQSENDASMQALLAGYDISNQEFDKSNAARANYINEKSMLRDKPMNEMLALLRGTSVEGGQFSPTFMQGTARSADLNGAMGAQYGAAMDKYNAGQAQRSSNMAVGGAVAGAAIIAI